MPRRWALAAILVLAAGLRAGAFTGLHVGDDIVYSRIAVDRLHGAADYFNIHQARSAFLLPITLSYALFGAGEVPLLLYNLLTSVGLVAALYFLGRRFFGEGAGRLGALVAAFHPNLVYFASEAHTDTPLAFWEAVTLLVFFSAAEAERPRPRLVLAGLLFGWCWLHKESAVFLLPFFAGHAVAARRRWTWYLPLAGAAAAVLAAELAGFWIMAGNPFQRFAVVQHWHAGKYMRELFPTSEAVLHRLFLDLPLQLFTPHYDGKFHGVVNGLGLVAGAVLLFRRAAGSGIVAGWFAALFLSFCFWPSSLAPFLPGFSLFEWTFPVLVGPLACLLGGWLSRWRAGAAAAALAALGGMSLATIQHSRAAGREFAAGAREARAWILRENPWRVVSDEKTVQALDFFDGHLPRRGYQTFEQAGEIRRGAVLVLDRFWAEEGRWWSQAVPARVRRPPPEWKKVYESARIAIYRP